MPVFVDEAIHPYGRMMMCHMVADSTDELNAMADKIGVARKWIQYPGTIREHYDICKAKRELAVRAGAVEVDSRWIGDRQLEMRRKIAAARASTEGRA